MSEMPKTIRTDRMNRREIERFQVELLAWLLIAALVTLIVGLFD